MSRWCPLAWPVSGVWGMQLGWRPVPIPAFNAPTEGLQPLPCTLLPLWHPPPGAGGRMRRGAMPDCKDAPGDGWRRPDPASPP